MHIIFLLITIFGKKPLDLLDLCLQGVGIVSLITCLYHLAQTTTKFGHFLRLFVETTLTTAGVIALLMAPVLVLVLIAEATHACCTRETTDFGLILISAGVTFAVMVAFCSPWLTVVRWRAGERAK